MATIDILRPMKNDFAQSLVKQYDRWGDLSPKQWACANRLANQVAVEKQVEGEDYDLSQIRLLINSLATHVKYPKIRLQGQDGLKYIIRKDKQNRINVELDQWEYNHRFGKDMRVWMGRVDGSTFFPSNRCTSEVVSILHSINNDPLGTLTAYGKLTGNCAICGRPLSDPRSISLGIGPVCAEHAGLKGAWVSA